MRDSVFAQIPYSITCTLSFLSVHDLVIDITHCNVLNGAIVGLICFPSHSIRSATILNSPRSIFLVSKIDLPDCSIRIRIYYSTQAHSQCITHFRPGIGSRVLVPTDPQQHIQPISLCIQPTKFLNSIIGRPIIAKYHPQYHHLPSSRSPYSWSGLSDFRSRRCEALRLPRVGPKVVTPYGIHHVTRPLRRHIRMCMLFALSDGSTLGAGATKRTISYVVSIGIQPR
jgi:hypothetical protein